MPETNTPQTLTPEQAYNVLVAEVHAPVFFNKLASVYGIVPQSREEAHELLLIASRLRNADEQDQVKQATARGNFYAEARQNLDTVLNQNGFQPPVEDDRAVKSAAADAVKNPLLKEAATVFANHMTQVLQRS